MRHRINFYYFLIVLVALVLAGCGKGPIAPASKIPAQKTAAKAPEPPAPLLEEAKVEREIYNYEQNDRRDPFLSLADIAKEKPQRKGGRPIENFDINEIQLSAIVWDSHQYYALVTLPDKKSFTVKRGMTLGLYGGKVEEITKDLVLIREQIKNYKGEVKTKDTILRLRKEGD